MPTLIYAIYISDVDLNEAKNSYIGKLILTTIPLLKKHLMQ